MKLVVIYIEADSTPFAHVATGGGMLPVCGKNPFPSRWERPVERTKPVCASCVAKLRKR